MYLHSGVFPDEFKQAIVTPLIKKPSLCKDDLKNYRPVSGLSFISKVTERVVAKQPKSHLSRKITWIMLISQPTNQATRLKLHF